MAVPVAICLTGTAVTGSTATGAEVTESHLFALLDCPTVASDLRATRGYERALIGSALSVAGTYALLGAVLVRRGVPGSLGAGTVGLRDGSESHFVQSGL